LRQFSIVVAILKSFRNEDYYDRTNHLPKKSHRSKSRTRHVLVVRVRTFEEPAILRRVAQGHEHGSVENRDQRSENGRVVRLQAFENNALLRRLSLEASVNVAGHPLLDDVVVDPECFDRRNQVGELRRAGGLH
jgi:hypothetical protein